MISAGDFRNGVTLEIEGQIFQIIEFQHVKPGKGAAFVRTKLKNIINGGVVEKTFRPTEKFPTARIDRVDMQYLYSDGDLYHFMNVENYDQIALNLSLIHILLQIERFDQIVEGVAAKGVGHMFRTAGKKNKKRVAVFFPELHGCLDAAGRSHVNKMCIRDRRRRC